MIGHAEVTTGQAGTRSPDAMPPNHDKGQTRRSWSRVRLLSAGLVQALTLETRFVDTEM